MPSHVTKTNLDASFHKIISFSANKSISRKDLRNWKKKLQYFPKFMKIIVIKIFRKKKLNFSSYAKNINREPNSLFQKWNKIYSISQNS